ncbi:unnamed protein product [Echinostoma caproni]|uniref:Uncharacterized protein n=1 Tax=Echinostoma caproni TaxID=27848 RepID=A0A183ALT6_9TREM|nr:unnamed protein product [Echinostoma caproni]
MTGTKPSLFFTRGVQSAENDGRQQRRRYWDKAYAPMIGAVIARALSVHLGPVSCPSDHIDSTGSTDSFLKFYPLTLTLHTVESGRNSLEFASTIGARMSEVDGLKPRPTSFVGKRRHHSGVSLQSPLVGVLSTPSAKEGDFLAKYLNYQSSVFDRSAALAPVDPEVYATYEHLAQGIADILFAFEMHVILHISKTTHLSIRSFSAK